MQGALTAPCGYKWQSNGISRFNKNYKTRLVKIKEETIMTREEKLYSMRMQDLEIVAAKLGIKINKKGAKSKAIEKILEAENTEAWENEAEAEKGAMEEVKAESDAITEATFNNKEKIPEEVSDEKPEQEKSEKVTKKANLKLKELTFNGETKSVREWAAELEMPWPTLYDRVNRNGWSVEEALTIPLGQRRPKSK